MLDKRLGREEAKVDQRSEELLELVTKLGPTFIKVGQALSIRTDLLPAPYVAGLVKLRSSRGTQTLVNCAASERPAFESLRGQLARERPGFRRRAGRAGRPSPLL